VWDELGLPRMQERQHLPGVVFGGPRFRDTDGGFSGKVRAYQHTDMAA
jgi:hypothetical protein